MENWWFQLFHSGCGVIVKLILNLVLVPIPEIGVNGAAFASVACHMVAFTIAITALRKNIKLNLGFKKFVFKPVVATAIMGICSYFTYCNINGIISERLATIVAIIMAVIIYAISVIVLKVFSKEELSMIPYGNKLCKVLEKIGIYWFIHKINYSCKFL